MPNTTARHGLLAFAALLTALLAGCQPKLRVVVDNRTSRPINALVNYAATDSDAPAINLDLRDIPPFSSTQRTIVLREEQYPGEIRLDIEGTRYKSVVTPKLHEVLIRVDPGDQRPRVRVEYQWQSSEGLFGQLQPADRPAPPLCKRGLPPGPDA